MTELDTRGRDVFGKGGRRIGQVRQLVVDPAAMKVRYLETRIHNSERRILVPIEGVLLDLQDHSVLLPLAASDTGALPPCPLEVTHDFDRIYDAEWTRRWGKPLSEDVTLVRLRRC